MDDALPRKNGREHSARHPPRNRRSHQGRRKKRATELQEAGKWPHLWRIVGQYSNISIIDVESNDELHALLSSLPLFPFMTIQVTPLAKHPSSIV
ncbi:muconolactone Delta-isomerase family protein [Pseudomonas sp.]|uniref:muconolactone Delta-isomerase family protein n=1 Tax=Pseudomonas sp. TaxID=306 RepID=UPI0028A94131|nr:muconolactone Delta-isomerase family protein [Pseudomonas sp.]